MHATVSSSNSPPTTATPPGTLPGGARPLGPPQPLLGAPTHGPAFAVTAAPQTTRPLSAGGSSGSTSGGPPSNLAPGNIRRTAPVTSGGPGSAGSTIQMPMQATLSPFPSMAPPPTAITPSGTVPCCAHVSTGPGVNNRPGTGHPSPGSIQGMATPTNMAGGRVSPVHSVAAAAAAARGRQVGPPGYSLHTQNAAAASGPILQMPNVMAQLSSAREELSQLQSRREHEELLQAALAGELEEVRTDRENALRRASQFEAEVAELRAKLQEAARAQEESRTEALTAAERQQETNRALEEVRSEKNDLRTKLESLSEREPVLESEMRQYRDAFERAESALAEANANAKSSTATGVVDSGAIDSANAEEVAHLRMMLARRDQELMAAVSSWRCSAKQSEQSIAHLRLRLSELQQLAAAGDLWDLDSAEAAESAPSYLGNRNSYPSSDPFSDSNSDEVPFRIERLSSKQPQGLGSAPVYYGVGRVGSIYREEPEEIPATSSSASGPSALKSRSRRRQDEEDDEDDDGGYEEGEGEGDDDKEEKEEVQDEEEDKFCPGGGGEGDGGGAGSKLESGNSDHPDQTSALPDTLEELGNQTFEASSGKFESPSRPPDSSSNNDDGKESVSSNNNNINNINNINNNNNISDLPPQELR